MRDIIIVENNRRAVVDRLRVLVGWWPVAPLWGSRCCMLCCSRQHSTKNPIDSRGKRYCVTYIITCTLQFTTALLEKLPVNSRAGVSQARLEVKLEGTCNDAAAQVLVP